MVINETTKNITNNQEEEGQQHQQTEELKKKIKRLQAERNELALMALYGWKHGYSVRKGSCK